MNKRNRLKQDAHQRSQAVCAEYHTILDASEGGSNASATIGNAVSTVTAKFAEQEACIDEAATAGKDARSWRSALAATLKAVATLAPFVDLDPSSATVWQLPAYLNDQRALAKAREFLDRVTRDAKAFLAKGLPQKVLDDLPKQIAGLEAARLARKDALRRYTAAGDAIHSAQADADKATRVVHTIFGQSDPVAVKKFRTAKRIGPATDTQAKTETPATPPESGQTTPPTATAKIA